MVGGGGPVAENGDGKDGRWWARYDSGCGSAVTEFSWIRSSIAYV